MTVDVLTVVGARPQFIKAFAVSRHVRPRHDEVLVHTGQHYDDELSGVFFEELGLPEPDYNLGVGSGTHGWQTAQMLTGIEELIADHDPDVVLTYGDTNSTLAAALAASKTDARLAHVEAGLRSGDRDMPEEVNRILTDHVSDLLFAPTVTAVVNLGDEGLCERVHLTGDVMFDALQWARERSRENSTVLADLGLEPGAYVLATVHRPRNADDPERLATILAGLGSSTLPVVLPLHPRTASRLAAFDLLTQAEAAATLIDPVGYLDFVALVANAERVVTDSGGVQKEAAFLGTPCLTLREETEWPETLWGGWNVLVGADASAIAEGLRADRVTTDRPRGFGDGTAARRVVDILEAGAP